MELRYPITNLNLRGINSWSTGCLITCLNKKKTQHNFQRWKYYVGPKQWIISQLKTQIWVRSLMFSLKLSHCVWPAPARTVLNIRLNYARTLVEWYSHTGRIIRSFQLSLFARTKAYQTLLSHYATSTRYPWHPSPMTGPQTPKLTMRGIQRKFGWHFIIINEMERGDCDVTRPSLGDR